VATILDFVEQVKAGKAFKAGSGFSGKGLERLDQERDLVKKIQKKVGLNKQIHVKVLTRSFINVEIWWCRWQ
jgi:hypothetical protein